MRNMPLKERNSDAELSIYDPDTLVLDEPTSHRDGSQALLKASTDLGKYIAGLQKMMKKFDEINRVDPSFAAKHRAGLGHYRRLYDLAVESQKAMRALNNTWRSE